MNTAPNVLGLDWLAWAVAFARVLPSALIVPAFGLRFLPAAMRVGIAAALALAVIPAVHATPSAPSGALGLLLVGEFIRGVPLALSTAAVVFAATMAGGLVDDLRGLKTLSAAFESPMGTLFTLLAAVAFLETGGASRLVAALARPESGPTLARAAFDVAGAISVAVAILAPVIVVTLVVDVAAALMVRATGSWSLSGVIAPLRVLVILASAGIAFERVAEAIVASTSIMK